MRRLCQFVMLAALAASSAAGYYHFVHYPSRNGPFTPIFEKFDLNTLVNKTVYFYVAEDRPALAPGDSYESLVGQARQALAVWNGVATSELRVAYGGVGNLAAAQAQTPGGEIVFEEMPPGVVARGGVTTRSPQAGGFISIVRSQVVLPLNLASRPTSGEAFFNTLVHEIGHALGLQHTQTGAAMSEGVTRSTTRARPLAADDAAGLSKLYPAAGFAAATGAIGGRVTTPGGRGLHLVSVVAVNAGGAVISALTGPDGAYRIEGLPPDLYYVYAHGLPPATQPGMGPGNVVLPLDDTGSALAAAGPVETQFYGGGKDPNLSTPVLVNAGASAEGVDFRLAERASLSIYDITTYSFPGPGLPGVAPAFLNASRFNGTLLATGPGLANNLRSVTVGVIGGGLQVAREPSAYGPDPRFAEIELEFTPVTGTGARHLVFSLNGEPYVRPGGVQLVSRAAPVVREVTIETENGGTPVLALAGENLGADSRVFLDGAAAAVRGFDEITGRLRVAPPPGPAGRQAIISVYSPDGQSSLFAQPASPATYTYPPADATTLTVTPASGRAGRDLMVEIQGTNTNFAEGQTVAGFGNPDIVVRRLWVASPTRLLAVISISPRAAQSATVTVSAISGTQLATLAAGFRIEAATTTTAPSVRFQALVNSATLAPRVAPGSMASLFGSNLTLGGSATAVAPLPATLGGVTVTLNDSPAPLIAVSPTQINLQIPFSIGVGPAILRVNNGAETSAGMVVQIDAAAPGLFRATNAAGAVVDANNAARLGETITLFGTGLGPVTPAVNAGVAAPQAATVAAVRVFVAGTELAPSYAGLAPGTAGLYQVNVPLPTDLPAGSAAPVWVIVDGQSSNMLSVALRAP